MGLRRLRAWLICLAAALILAQFGRAQEISNSTYTFEIQNGKVLVTSEFSLSESTMLDFALDLPNDAFDVSVSIDGIPRTPIYSDETEKKLRIRNIGKDVSMRYSTKDLLKGSAFFVTVKTVYRADNMNVIVILPEGYSLLTPVKGETFETGSVYPVPSQVRSDGQSMVFEWHLKGLEANDTFSVLMLLKKKFPWAVIIAVGSMILISGAVLFYLRERQKRPKVVVEKVENIEEHLKEEEAQIINILKQRGGSCEQGTLRVIMNIPKSTLSTLISELEERKIIIKQKKGKKNIISLKK